MNVSASPSLRAARRKAAEASDRLATVVAVLIIANRVNVKQLQAGGIQPLLHDLSKALQHLVAQIVVLLALRAQTLSVEGDGAYVLEGMSVKLPE